MSIKEQILNLIFPPVCAFCNSINYNYLCDSCWQRLQSIKTSKIDDYADSPVFFDEHFYMFEYKDDIRELILKYKFDEKSYIYKSISKFFVEDRVFLEEFISKYDFIISVPIHKKRFKKRGYNQSELIACDISKNCNMPYYKNVLKKEKNIVAQSLLDGLDRVRNIKDAFEICEDFKKDGLIRDKKIAIFDDVFTTGATVNECAKLLKQEGACCVGVFTIAKSIR